MRAADVARIEAPLLVLIYANFLTVQKDNAVVPLRDLRRLLRRDLKQLLRQSLDGLSAFRSDARQGFRVETLRRKDVGTGILRAANHIPQQHGGDHGSRHAPFLKTRSHIPMRAVFRVAPDIGDAVGCHAILSRPMGDFSAVQEPFLCRLPQQLVFPSGAVLTAAVTAAAQQEQVSVVAKRVRALFRADPHSV